MGNCWRCLELYQKELKRELLFLHFGIGIVMLDWKINGSNQKHVKPVHTISGIQ
jgi:hypothetical protein